MNFTLSELKQRQQHLLQEKYQDQAALTSGKIDAAEATRRSIHREFEQRWLEMEAILIGANDPTRG